MYDRRPPKTANKRDRYTGHRTETGQLAPGNPGGPGRPLGAKHERTKFRELIVDAIGQDKLLDIVRTVAARKPADLVKVLASLEPREHEIKVEAKHVHVVMFQAEPPPGWTPPDLSGVAVEAGVNAALIDGEDALE